MPLIIGQSYVDGRYRIVRLLGQGGYGAVYQAVAWWISRDGSRTDPACKDALRLYYGSKKCTVAPNWSVLGKASIDVVMAEYKAAHPAPVKPVKATVPVTPSNGMKAAKLAQLGRTVNGARDGERHNTLLKMARLAGGCHADYRRAARTDAAACFARPGRQSLQRP